jgi:hypothetical protein
MKRHLPAARVSFVATSMLGGFALFACSKPPAPHADTAPAQTKTVEDVPATPPRAPGQLDVEHGFVSIGENWYQGLFGCARRSDGEHQRLTLHSYWENADSVRVTIGATTTSGIHLVLHMHFADGQVSKCNAEGFWDFDAGAKPADFAGQLEQVNGTLRVDINRDKRPAVLRCLFVVRGWMRRPSDMPDSPELLMGGFEIDLNK